MSQKNTSIGQLAWLTATLLAIASLAQAAPFAWDGGGDNINWNDGQNWDTNTVPDVTTADVTVNPGGGVAATLNNSTIFDVNNLTLGSTSSLTWQAGGDLRINGDLTNDGTVNIGGAGSQLLLHLNGFHNLTGSGQIVLSNAGVLGVTGFGRNIANGVSHAIVGAGSVGQGLPVIQNAGTIDANVAGQTLTLGARNGVVGNTNTGTLRASNGGTLTINAATWDNAGGLIEADGVGSIVKLNSGTVYKNGTLSTSNNGQIQLAGTGVSGVELQNVTSNGTVSQPNNIDAMLQGTITNNGTFNQSSAGGSTDIDIIGDVLLTGTGTWNLSDNVNNNWLGQTNVTTNAEVLTNGAAHTIQGAGSLGSNVMALINNGTISATGVNALTIDPSNNDVDGNGNDVQNNGTLQATSGATLRLAGGAFSNTAGAQVIAGTGSTVNILAGATLTNQVGGTVGGNGTLDIDGTFVNLGTVAPGLSPGTLSVLGNYDNGSGILAIELGGTTQGVDYDLLNVSGSAVLGGELALTFFAGFQGSVANSDVFTVLTSSGLSSAFANVLSGERLFTTDGFGSFLVTYDASNVVLSDFLVPEPTSMILMGTAVMAFGLRRKRSA